MSLVMEALRRVEKVDSRAGSIGATVASYRPAPKPRGSAVPLLLGLLTGGALVLVFSTPSANLSSLSGDTASVSVPRARLQKGAAGLPPPLIIEPAARPARAQTPSGAGSMAQGAIIERRVEAPRPTPPLVLQAISERDSKPIAIINDQLVREGDRIGAARVLRIGPDSVEVTLENGQHETVRFAPPPPSTPESTPTPSPLSR